MWFLAQFECWYRLELSHQYTSRTSSSRTSNTTTSQSVKSPISSIVSHHRRQTQNFKKNVPFRRHGRCFRRAIGERSIWPQPCSQGRSTKHARKPLKNTNTDAQSQTLAKQNLKKYSTFEPYYKYCTKIINRQQNTNRRP